MQLDEAMRTLRFLHGAFIVSILLMVSAGEMVGPPPQTEFQVVIFALAFVALADVGIGFFLRRNMLEGAQETLRRNPGDAPALKAWHGGHVISFVFAETVVLFGLAVRFLAGSLELAAPFYVVGFAMLILWSPRRPDA